MFHTFFVVTVQFAAFFTIVFWLFLLFYSFFIFEDFEYHFNDKRGVHKRLQASVREAVSPKAGLIFHANVFNRRYPKYKPKSI